MDVPHNYTELLAQSNKKSGFLSRNITQSGNRTRTKETRRVNALICQGYRCAYCYKEIQKGGGTIEHIHPRSAEQKYLEIPNTVVVCKLCNRQKDNNSLLFYFFYKDNLNERHRRAQNFYR